MKHENISYFRVKTNYIEFIYSKDSDLSFSEHNHVLHYTIGLILDGTIHLERSAGILKCKKDSYFIIPPYEPHGIYANGGKYTMLSICLTKDFVLEYELEKALPILLDLADLLLAKNIISVENLPIISDAIHMLFLNMTGGNETETDSTQSAARNALTQLTQAEMHLDNLSRSVFMSKYHFIREFKKIIGLTPHHFQIQNRIRKAQRLLEKYENETITKVALATGFCDQSHFIRCFKKIVGLTPSQYIKAQNTLQ